MLRRIESIKKSPFSLSLLSGVLLVLIQPPVSLSYLAFFALIPLFYSMDEENLRQSFIRGFVAGIACYLGLIYWAFVAVHKYGGINIYLSFLILMLFVLYMALYTACFTLGIALCRERFSIPIYLSAPPVWVDSRVPEGFPSSRGSRGAISPIPSITFSPSFRSLPLPAHISFPSFWWP